MLHEATLLTWKLLQATKLPCVWCNVVHKHVLNNVHVDVIPDTLEHSGCCSLQNPPPWVHMYVRIILYYHGIATQAFFITFVVVVCSIHVTSISVACSVLHVAVVI